MDLFANVGNTQKSMDYSQINRKDEEINSHKLQENTKLQEKKQNEDVKIEEKQVTKDKLQELTTQLNKEMAPLNPDIKFSFNDKIDELIVNVVDKNTDKIIRKIPSDEALKIMEKMRDLVGALFDDKG